MKKILFIVSLLCFIFLSPNSKVYGAEIINSWTSTTSLPNPVASHISFSRNNKLYLIGGATTSVIPQNIYADLNANGSISSWINSNVNSPSRYFHASVIKDDNVYLIGGANFPPQIHSASVYRGKINSFNIINQWDNMSSLPEPLSLGAATTVGNKIYFAGGTNDSGESSDVYMTTIDSDGTIGNWTPAGQLPEPLSGLGLIEHNGYLIALSGQNGSGQKKNKVYKTALNSDGTLTGWQETTSLPEATYRGGFVKVGSKIVTIAGIGSTNNFHNKVFFADINNDGTISSWTQSQHNLPQSICCGAATYANGYIYYSGGYNASLGAYQNTVYFTKVDLNQPNSLNVPYFSQNALPWGPTEYDSASSRKLSSPTMDRWGCAVTSVAMLLKYHGMTEFANGTLIDPGSVNKWLDNNNGYKKSTGSAVILWGSVDRLTNELYKAGKSPVKLVYKKSYEPSPFTTSLLNSDLTTNKIPHIFYVNHPVWKGHYVVGKGILPNNNYLINDPEYNYSDLTNFAGRTFLRTHRYEPSLTNFSKIEMVVEPNVEILVTDEQGNQTGKLVQNGEIQEFNDIPSAEYYFEPPTGNPDENDQPETLGDGVNRFVLPEPGDGNYEILLTSLEKKAYSLDIHTTESGGEYIAKTLEGIVNSTASDSYQVQYSQTQSSTPIRTITFQSTIDDINEQTELGNIKRLISKGLIVLIKTAEKSVIAGKNKVAIVTLTAFEKSIKELRGKGISEGAYQILLEDVKALKSQIN